MTTRSAMVCLILGIVIAMSVAISATEYETLSDALGKDDHQVDETETQDNVSVEENNEVEDESDEDDSSTFVRGFGRFLRSKKYAPKKMTCDKYPKVCRAKGSTKKDCCKKICVSKKSDKKNCGKCGKKCKYSETCCKGKCIKIMSDKKNCGGCGRKCKKGRKCRYGMCSYAYY